MDKAARTRTGARALEALTGGLVGAGLGAVGQAVLHEPKRPRDIVDDQGFIRRRELTAREKRRKRDLVLAAASMAAVGGGLLSMGGSAIGRSAAARLEREMAPKIIDEHLEGLRHVVRKRHDVFRRRQEARLVTRAGRKASELDYLNSRQLLDTEEGNLNKLLRKAETARSKRPWGLSSQKPGGAPGSRYSPDRMTTHRGQVAEHYDKLQTRYGLPALQGPDDRFTGEKFYESLLERLSGHEKAAFSFREEALAIQRALEG
jgi:hypothetical protein